MGLFFGRNKRHGASNLSFEISATCESEEISHEEVLLLQSGWKRDIDDEIYPPETVWVNTRTDIYHCFYHCNGTAISQSVVERMPESEAVSLGYTRCRRCDWGYNPWV